MRAGHIAALVLSAIILAAAALPLAVANDPGSAGPEAAGLVILLAGFTALGAIGRAS
jgi:hypothetical protein